MYGCFAQDFGGFLFHIEDYHQLVLGDKRVSVMGVYFGALCIIFPWKFLRMIVWGI